MHEARFDYLYTSSFLFEIRPKDSLTQRFTDFSELPQNIPEKFPRSRWNRTTPNEEGREENAGRRSCNREAIRHVRTASL